MSEENGPPPLWWSPTYPEEVIRVTPAHEFTYRWGETKLIPESWCLLQAEGYWSPLNEWPDDAVPLGVIEDPKHRGPSYQLGYRDGFNASRAGVPNPTEEDQ